MKEIRRCPITGRFRAKGLGRSVLRSPEERDASRKSKVLTTVATVVLGLFLFVHVPEKIALLNQRIAMQQVEMPNKKVDLKREPLRIEPDWVMMTIPESSWSVVVEKPEPPKVKEPEKKPEPKPEPKPKPKPKVQPVKSAGGAKVAPQTTGAAKTVTETQIVFNEIIEVIERYKRYPERARSQGLEGRVMLQVAINADGSVGEINLQKGGHPLLRRATLQAAKHLKDVRTRATSAMTLVVPVNYDLN